MLLSELQLKDIINLDNGEKIGYISDLEIDVEYGKIISLIVAVKSKWFGFIGQDEEIRIQWHYIKKIGKDVILVSIPQLKQQIE